MPEEYAGPGVVADPENEDQGPGVTVTPAGDERSFERALGNAPAKSIGAAMARIRDRTAKATTGNAQLVLPRETTPMAPPAVPNASPARSRPKMIAATVPVLFSPSLKYDV